MLKRITEDGKADRGHQDGDRDRGEEKLQPAEARIEAEQETKHGPTLVVESIWPESVFRAVTRPGRWQMLVCGRWAGSVKLSELRGWTRRTFGLTPALPRQPTATIAAHQPEL